MPTYGSSGGGAAGRAVPDHARIALPPDVTAELKRKQRLEASKGAALAQPAKSAAKKSRRRHAIVEDEFEWVVPCVVRRRTEPLRRLLGRHPHPSLCDLKVPLPVPKGGAVPTHSPLSFARVVAQSLATEAVVEGTLLHYAAAAGYDDVALLLMQAAGRDAVWAPDTAGRSVLHAAAWRGRVTIVDRILSDTEAKDGTAAVVAAILAADMRGATPRDLAAAGSHVAAVAAMDAALASINADNERIRAAAARLSAKKQAQVAERAAVKAAARAVRESVAMGDPPASCSILRSAAPPWGAVPSAPEASYGLTLASRASIAAAAAIAAAAPPGTAASRALGRLVPKASTVASTFAATLSGRTVITCTNPMPIAVGMLRPPRESRRNMARIFAPPPPPALPLNRPPGGIRRSSLAAPRTRPRPDVPAALADIDYDTFAKQEVLDFERPSGLVCEIGRVTSAEAQRPPLTCCVVRAAAPSSGLLVGDVIVALSAAPAGLPPGRIDSAAGGGTLGPSAVIGAAKAAQDSVADASQLKALVEQCVLESAATGRPGVMCGVLRSEGGHVVRVVCIVSVAMEGEAFGAVTTTSAQTGTATTMDGEDEEDMAESYGTTEDTGASDSSDPW